MKAPFLTLAAGDTAAGEAVPEAAFRAMFAWMPEALMVVRWDDSVVLDVNPTWQLLTGYGRDEVVGRSPCDVEFWGHAAGLHHLAAGLAPDTAVRDVPVELRLPGGAMGHLCLTASVVQIAGDTLVLCCLRRAATQAEVAPVPRSPQDRVLEDANAQLEHQVELYRLTESVANVGYWLHYPGEHEVHMSAGYATVAGFGDRRSAPIADHLQGLMPEDRAVFDAAAQAMDGRTIEYRWHHPDGHVLWVRSRMYRQMEQGVVRANIGVVQEVSSEKAAIKAARDQLMFIQKITGRAPGMLFEFQTWGDDRLEFHFASAGSHELLGVTPEVLRSDVNHLFRRIERSDTLRLIGEALAAVRAGTLWQSEFLMRPLEGGPRWLLINAAPDVQPDNSVLWCGAITDITSQKEALARLQESEARFRSLTELSSDWYWEQDAAFRFVRFDGSPQIASALPTQSYLGKKPWEFESRGVTEEAWARHRAQLDAHEVFHDFETQRLRADGSWMWITLNGAPMFDALGEFKGYRGTGRDISARKQAEAEIERLAFFDALTGLPNRRMLMERLKQAMDHSARHITHGALLFIDLDNFKILNDTLGHHVGDELLKQVAQRLIACVRSVDTVARLGGDEFVVMLEDIGEVPSDAAALAESIGRKVLVALNQEYVLGGQRHHSSPSIGITLLFQHLHTLDELLKRADLAMYQAKGAGRNTLRFFDPEMQAAATARASMEKDLRQALQYDGFVLYYQPVVDAQSRVTGVEALLRWVHPQRGLISPAQFIPVAEQSGLIFELGHWVLQVACAQLVAWSAQPATSTLTMAVNVSARQFRHPDFCNQVLGLLQSTGANPNRLKLELTESLLLSDVEDAVQKMGQLRAVGVGFSLDDFGTGYSSLSYLKRLPLDQLKIDQSFVRDVLIDPNDAAIARTILTLAHSLDLGVVAEGVESEGQRQFLLQNGCRSFQGYLFGRPVPLDQLQLGG
jgi:diguanylate cyclase (GGDEF)-like protein/PAS domain S-box-containing protein